jgi:hypothetical protein
MSALEEDEVRKVIYLAKTLGIARYLASLDLLQHTRL